MADAAIVAAWKDVTDQLNAKQGGWSVPFNAERKYVTDTKLENLRAVKVQVMIPQWRITPDNRDDWAHEFDIQIAIHYRADAKAGEQPLEQYDQFLKLVEEITDYWEVTRPSAADCPLVAIALGAADNAPYHPDHIETHHTITSIIRLTFRKYRDSDA